MSTWLIAVFFINYFLAYLILLFLKDSTWAIYFFSLLTTGGRQFRRWDRSHQAHRRMGSLRSQSSPFLPRCSSALSHLLSCSVKGWEVQDSRANFQGHPSKPHLKVGPQIQLWINTNPGIFPVSHTLPCHFPSLFPQHIWELIKVHYGSLIP